MKPKIRCAIYTRKSSEDGLEQEFNSLDAQREACTAYITSQKAEGWVLLPEAYDDGGISGGTLKRPALQRLLTDLDEGRVDQIVVYKIDRLSRSLADFAKIVDRLVGVGASFVSVTQSFNTATSMGRLTLNMLLSFAQFEREVTAERIRDKIAASKRRGLWMGGNVPLGYDPDGRTLIIKESEAKTVRVLYDLYREHGNIRLVKERADGLNLRSKQTVTAAGVTRGGTAFDRGHIHHILTNPIYAGRIRHHKNIYEGLHEPIIDPEVWDEVQRRLMENHARIRGEKNAAHPSPLAGKLFDETGDRLTPSHSSKNGKRLRYYISRRLVTDRSANHPEAWRLPAPQLEAAIAKAVAEHVSAPGFLPRTIPGIMATDVDQFRQGMDTLASNLNAKSTVSSWADLIAKTIIEPGSLAIALNAQVIADHLGLKADRLESDALQITAAFRLRRRGVETKIILGSSPPEIDQTLTRNIASGIEWYTAIRNGTTFEEIAARDGSSVRRIQAVTNLAFLSPTIIDHAVNGTLPPHITTDYLLKKGFPSDWAQQDDLLT
ncbi:recombinase family protein [Falsihalocynthiibacter arcticus]|uniref:Resolvase n=1 Tax=Falsihalocynthiibacter arcticus TaxID=1579316 RepID=A0A126V0P8_9RHOB|nr:recombinase family protein [Falsihalocynthiibacter arcticus]AML51911.1 resolvase [Falsihalocynthiibacter arcticus]